MDLDEGLIVQCDRAVRTSRGGDPRTGLDLARQAHRRAREEGEPHGILLALNTVAICLSGRGSHVLALATALDAYRMGREIGWRAQAAHALLTLGASSYDLFELPDKRSIALVRSCLDEALALPDASLEVRARNVLGIMLAWRRKFDESYAELARAMARVPESDGTTPPSLLAGNVAHIAVRKADAAQGEARAAAAADAHRRLDQALDQALAARSVGDELRVYFNRGWLRRLEGRHAEALADYERSLALARQLRNPARVADIATGIGDACTALERHAEAAEAYEAAYAVADQIRPAKQLHEACEKLAAAHDRQGHASAAEQARSDAARERAAFDRDRAHARAELERILADLQK